MEFYFGLFLVFLVMAYLYGALNTERERLISMIEYGLIQPHYTITRVSTRILAFALFAAPVLNLYRLLYYSTVAYWEIYIVLTIIVVILLFGIMYFVMTVTKLVFGKNAIFINWVVLLLILWTGFVFYHAPI